MRRGFPFAVAGLLILTSLVKAFDTVQSARLQVTYELPLWLIISTVQAELLVGLMLLLAPSSKLSWIAGLALFVAFATFSLYRALAGYESCGCFGSLQLNPWWTFAFDVGIVSLFVTQRRTLADYEPLASKRLAVGATSFLLLGSLSLLLILRSAPTVLTGAETDVSESGVLILKPKEWIGQDFPLHDAISPSINLTKGDCIVLLYHHDCPKCIEALARYKQLVKSAAEHGDDIEVVIVEVPPFGELEYETEPLRPARLSADKEWFVQAPVELQLRDGKVRLASLELPSIAEVP